MEKTFSFFFPSLLQTEVESLERETTERRKSFFSIIFTFLHFYVRIARVFQSLVDISRDLRSFKISCFLARRFGDSRGKFDADCDVIKLFFRRRT